MARLASPICNFNKSCDVEVCNPLSLTFNVATITNCCTGSATFTVTE